MTATPIVPAIPTTRTTYVQQAINARLALYDHELTVLRKSGLSSAAKRVLFRTATTIAADELSRLEDFGGGR